MSIEKCTIPKQSTGGVARANVLRQEAIERYYKNPVICQNCSEIIHPKDKEKIRSVRISQFCSQSCAGKRNNSLRFINYKGKKKCKDCGFDIRSRRNGPERCSDCRKIFSEKILDKTKAEVPRSYIGVVARKILMGSERPLACEECGYDKHVDACHKKAVVHFDKTSTIREINDLSNLKWLCKNHHWELDHSLGVTSMTAHKKFG